jgi:hypothetical protein
MSGPYNYLDGPGPSPFEVTSPHSDVPAIIDVAYVPDDGRLFATTNSPLSHLLGRTIGRRAAPNCSIIASHDRLSALRVTFSLDLPCLALRLQLRVWPPPPLPAHSHPPQYILPLAISALALPDRIISYCIVSSSAISCSTPAG